MLMQCDKEEKVVIVLKMGVADAKLLRDIVQNSLMEDEPHEIELLRKDIFDCLNQSKIGLNKYLEGE